MTKKKISLNNPWFVTLISTMIGIIAGLYITSYFENNSLYNAKEKAIQQVESELKDNYDLLKTFHEELASKYEPVVYLLSNLNNNIELIIPKDSLESFKQRTKNVFEFEKAESINDSHLKLRGDFNFNFESKLIVKKLSNIVWNSYKQTNYLSITSFECLTDVETFYVMQEEVNIKADAWKNEFFLGNFIKNPKNIEKFMNDWRTLLLKQELLLGHYEFIDNVLTKCE